MPAFYIKIEMQTNSVHLFMIKKVKQLLYAHLTDMGGVPVRQPFPTQNVGDLDPFLLLHHHAQNVPEGWHPTDVGVGPHPHRGFSPVTFVLDGSLHHRDSRGNSSVVHSNGAQWLEAGRGIIHSERPAKEMLEQGGLLEIVQLWVNTPAKFKMEQPRYLPLQEEDIPAISEAESKTHWQLFAGKQDVLTGPIKSKVPLLMISAQMEAGGKKTFEVPAGFTCMIYLSHGQVRLPGFGLIEPFHLIVMEKEGTKVEIEALGEARFLLLAGQPLEEEVTVNGPFVMSNQTQIMEAMRDYQMGKMGFLVEEF